MTHSDETPGRSPGADAGLGSPGAPGNLISNLGDSRDRAGDLIEVFNDYLDRGERPPPELLESSPDHHLALDALLRFRRLTGDLLAEDVAAEPVRDDGWVATILTNIHAEARAGRSIPLTHPSSIADLSLSEGAVRGLVRAAGDAVSGTLIGACRLEGEVTVSGAPITVAVDASVFWGERIPSTAERIRAAIESVLLLHTELNVVAVDVTVTDVHLRSAGREDGQ